MGCWTSRRGGGSWREGMERMQERAAQWCGPRRAGTASNSSGNRAFDEYRAETLRRLEEEQQEFKDFLARLRHAKDKEEFDAFMAQHKNRPTPPNDQPPQS